MELLIEKGVRQGALLPLSALGLNLLGEVGGNRALPEARVKKLRDQDLLVVLSQDCDIANPGETHIEVVVAKELSAGNARRGEAVRRVRSTRKLHFRRGGTYFECHIDWIASIRKELFLNEADFTALDVLEERSREMLITWRINRYARAPLPDTFNRAFVSGYLRGEGRALASLLEARRDAISDLYVFVFPHDETAQTYQVSITVLVTMQCPETVFSELEAAMAQHIQALHDLDNGMNMLQADGVPLSDHGPPLLDLVLRPEEFTMDAVFAMKRLAVDYLCFPDD